MSMLQTDGWQAKEAARILQNVRATPQETLLAGLLQGNSAKEPGFCASATPSGYHYDAYVPPKREGGHATLHSKRETVAYHAHPSDLTGDFAPFIIHYTHELGGSFHQVLLTRGEKGAALPEEQTAALRRQEEEKSAARMGIGVEYLRTADGGYFPDGKLMEHLPELTGRIKVDLAARKPQRLILPSPWPDHPDHLAIYIAGMNAVTQLRDEGQFKTGGLEILACEPEFGAPHAVKAKAILARGRAHARTGGQIGAELKRHAYRYHLDQATGLVHPAPDIAGVAESETDAFAHGPFAVPAFIVKVSDGMTRKALTALLEHKTQTEGKRYGHLIPGLHRVRGHQAGAEWAAGLYPIHIPGVTAEGTPFINALPPETVVQLKKNTAPASTRASSFRAALHAPGLKTGQSLAF